MRTDVDEHIVLGPMTEERTGEGAVGWSSSRSGLYVSEKTAMADAFVQHDFLAEPDGDPELGVRETAASILVNAGTSPHAVVARSLEWMREKWEAGGPARTVRWFTGGALVSGALLDFRERYRKLWPMAELFLFPGPVDSNLESVCGEHAAEYVKDHFKWNITCSLLSSHSFDMATGEACFFFPYEISFQRECALYKARDKFLFLDPSKFRRKDGGRGYDVAELLGTCDNLSIYTVASAIDDEVVEDFKKLGHHLLGDKPVNGSRRKVFRLCIVGNGRNRPQRLVLRGYLNEKKGTRP